ncbi:MAG: hypothetical protein AAF800_01385 [Planctomycetota bacterium]
MRVETVFMFDLLQTISYKLKNLFQGILVKNKFLAVVVLAGTGAFLFLLVPTGTDQSADAQETIVSEAPKVESERRDRAKEFLGLRYSSLELRQRESVTELRRLERESNSGLVDQRRAGKAFDPLGAAGVDRIRLGPSYDPESFRKNSEPYLAVVDPQRVTDFLAFGTPDAEPLEAVGSMVYPLDQGESVRLRVRTRPQAAVTFLANDGGVFGNGLPCVSVQANRRGVASARFYADESIIGGGSVTAASPEAIGTLQLSVDVSVP